MNLYQYCFNRPSCFKDPYGLLVIGLGGSGTGGTGGGGTGGAQIVVDTGGEIGIYIHGGAGPYLGASGGGSVDFSVYDGSINDLNGLCVSTGLSGIIGPGAGPSVGFEVNNATGFGGTGGFTLSGGIGTGTPVEGHSFLEYGVVIPLTELIPTPGEIADYWSDVFGDIWDYLFGDEEKSK